MIAQWKLLVIIPWQNSVNVTQTLQQLGLSDDSYLPLVLHNESIFLIMNWEQTKPKYM